MFKRSLLCTMVLGMMSVTALADAATDARETAPNPSAPMSSKAGTDSAGHQNQLLLNQAISVLHAGRTDRKMQSLTGDSVPQCSICHG